MAQIKNREELRRKMLEDIIKCLGGADNITTATNCMTRLRISVSDETKVDENKLKNLSDVLGLVHDRTCHYEIIVGPGKCKKYADKLHTMGIGISKKDMKKEPQSSKKKSLRSAVKVIGDIFIPMIPGVMTAGLCAGFASLLTQVYPGYKDSSFWDTVYTILSLISTSFMAYVTAWAGYRAAERFGATPILGGMLGMITSLDMINDIATVLGLYNESAPLRSVLCVGKGGVLAVIFGVFLLSKVEKFFRKRIPNTLDIFLTPFLTIIICVVPYILLIMPLFGLISAGIATVIGGIVSSDILAVRLLGGFIGAALFLPLVTTGMHHGLVGFYLIQLEEIGYVTLYPALAMAGAGQVGAALAIRRMAKKVGNIRLSNVATSGIPAGLLGVGEPLVYGVTLPLGKPFITAGLGAGFGGALVMGMQVASTTWGPSGLLGVFVMTAGPNGFIKNAIIYLGGLVISYIGGYVITSIFMKEKDLMPEEQMSETEMSKDEISTEQSSEQSIEQINEIGINAGDSLVFEGSYEGLISPCAGEVIPMADIPDEVFSAGIMGNCVGIMPVDGEISAPCSGTVVNITDTMHAFVIEKENGDAVLVHVGIDTVSLKGEGFSMKVSEGDVIEAGAPVMSMDLDVVNGAGLSPMVIAVMMEG
ncbi:MAG: glucose PTS transporter subunit IIA [Eubacterium sp.]|nr:glucose PTS transporter subunit IIA [Eubacterium sp.]